MPDHCKRCPQCGCVKDVSSFYAERRAKKGIASFCKSCDLRRCSMKGKSGPRQQSWVSTREQEEVQTKQRACSVCFSLLPLDCSSFYADPTKRHGLNTKCIECCRVKNAEAYGKDANARKAYQKNWRESNPGALLEWQKNNRDKTAVYNNKRRSLTEGPTFSAEEWVTLCDSTNNSCVCCGATDKPLTVDHIIPVSKGGSNTIENIQPLCKSCNSSKHTSTINFLLKRSLGIAVQSA